MPYLYLDSTFLLIIPALILSIYAQYKVKSTFHKYEKVANSRGISGAEMAKNILQREGITVPVERTKGWLGDHYDPMKKVLRLSEKVYEGRSIAAIGVAAHEAGHAIQHARAYHPLMLRTALYPVVSATSYLAPILIIIGLIVTASPKLFLAGIILFAISVVFTLITLPVEFNASKRAVAVLQASGITHSEEINGVKKVLSAAAFTYVAATITAVLELLRLILIFQRRN